MYSPGEEYSEVTAVDLKDKEYYIVKTDGNNKLVLASAATDAILGVLHDGGRMAGDTASVMLINGPGTYKVKVGSSPVAKDAYLTSDANGLAVSTTTTGHRVFGRAVRAAAAGAVVEYIKLNEKY